MIFLIYYIDIRQKANSLLKGNPSCSISQQKIYFSTNYVAHLAIYLTNQQETESAYHTQPIAL